MGFRNKILRVTLVIMLFGLKASAQVNQNDIKSIYNKWALSIGESSDEILVFRDEEELWFDNIHYDEGEVLRFSRYDNVFFLKHSRQNIGYVRCGNHIPNVFKQKPQWEKRIWRLEKENDILYLILESLIAEKGKKYVLFKRETYEVLDLEEDHLVLQKLVFEEFN